MRLDSLFQMWISRRLLQVTVEAVQVTVVVTDGSKDSHRPVRSMEYSYEVAVLANSRNSRNDAQFGREIEVS